MKLRHLPGASASQSIVLVQTHTRQPPGRGDTTSLNASRAPLRHANNEKFCSHMS
jgi:hypothetical protein